MSALLKETVSCISELDELSLKKAGDRLEQLAMPKGALGDLMTFGKRCAGIMRTEKPCFKKKVIFTMAGDHGVAREGVSAYPGEVTIQMVLNFLKGGAGINALADHVGAEVVVVDMGVAHEFGIVNGLIDCKVGMGTASITKGPAMTRDMAVKSIEAGIGLVKQYHEQGVDIIGTGDMGIANTTPSSAIAAVITGKPVEEITGRGTGISDDVLTNKISVIKRALSLNNPDPDDGLDILSKVGGFEIGGIAGLILGSAACRIPVVVDGFISTAGALIALKICPLIKDYIFMAHKSMEAGHRYMLDYIGHKPMLDLNLRLGEGTGAALGISLVEAGVKILTDVFTFEEAGVHSPVDN